MTYGNGAAVMTGPVPPYLAKINMNSKIVKPKSKARFQLLRVFRPSGTSSIGSIEPTIKTNLTKTVATSPRLVNNSFPIRKPPPALPLAANLR